jgi:hypothetical protein
MQINKRLSILSNARPEHLRLHPYPHLVIEGALDPDVFAELEASYPADELIVDGRPAADTWYDYPACKVVRDERIAPIWRDFFSYHTSAAFFAELLALTGDALRRTNPTLERRVGRSLEQFRVGLRPGGREDALAPGADVSMECQFYVNYTRQPRTVRGPHVDRPSELFAALLYFRRPEDDSQGADLAICEAAAPIYRTPGSVRISQLPAEIDDDLVKTVDTARYRANTLVLFLNSPASIHAVTPRTPTPLTRRHINFCCDVPVPLFDLDLPPRLALKKKLESVPGAWRVSRYI